MDVLNEDMIVRCRHQLDSAHRELFTDCSTAVKSFLAGHPFSLFESSMYFHRFLQWKWLERYVCMRVIIIFIIVNVKALV